MALTTRFISPVIVEVIPARTGSRIYRLKESLEYVTSLIPDDPIIVVPAGYESDGASVPRVFWSFFPPSGQYTKAAILHDWLCDTRKIPSSTAHAIFAEALQDLRVPRRVRWPMSWAVRLFGPRWTTDKGQGRGGDSALSGS